MRRIIRSIASVLGGVAVGLALFCAIAALIDPALAAEGVSGSASLIRVLINGTESTPRASGLDFRGGFTITNDPANAAIKRIAVASVPSDTITSAMIVDGTIATGDLADSSVTSAKIADSTIVAADIANTTITGAKMVNGTVQATQLGTGAQIESSVRAAISAFTADVTVPALIKIDGRDISVDGARLDTLNPGYSTVAFAGTAATQRGTLNFIAGNGISLPSAAAADNSGAARTDATITAVINGASLSLGSSGLSVNTANANTWTAAQTFNTAETVIGVDTLYNTEALPAAPSSTNMILSNSPYANRQSLWVSTGAAQHPFIPTFGRRRLSWAPNFTGGAATGGIARGYSIGNYDSCTVSHPTPASTTLETSLIRTKCVAAATTQNRLSGFLAGSSESPFWLGNAARLGGFLIEVRFSAVTNTNGDAAFIGLRNGSIINGTPSTINNSLSMGFDAADASSGNWFFNERNGTTTTRHDLGSSCVRTANEVYDLAIYATPNASSVGVRVTDLTTGTLCVETSYNTTLPTSTSFLTFEMYQQNGTGAVAAAIEMVSMEAVVGSP